MLSIPSVPGFTGEYPNYGASFKHLASVFFFKIVSVYLLRSSVIFWSVHLRNTGSIFLTTFPKKIRKTPVIELHTEKLYIQFVFSKISNVLISSRREHYLRIV